MSLMHTAKICKLRVKRPSCIDSGEHSKEHFHLINGVRATNRFDDYRTDCRNSHCQQQSYSGLRSPYPDDYAQPTYAMTPGPAH